MREMRRRMHTMYSRFFILSNYVAKNIMLRISKEALFYKGLLIFLTT